MDADQIKQSTDVAMLQERHRRLLQAVEEYRMGKNTELTEQQAVAEKVLIKARLRELGATIRPETRQSTPDSARAKQTVKP